MCFRSQPKWAMRGASVRVGTWNTLLELIDLRTMPSPPRCRLDEFVQSLLISAPA